MMKAESFTAINNISKTRFSFKIETSKNSDKNIHILKNGNMRKHLYKIRLPITYIEFTFITKGFFND